MKANSVSFQGKPALAVITQGKLPIPPISGGSTLTVVHEMSEFAQEYFKIDVFGPSHPKQSTIEMGKNINYFRYPAQVKTQYFSAILDHIRGNNYAVIQVENRPLLIPRAKANNPKSKLVLSLHSLNHVEEKTIRKSTAVEILKQCHLIVVYSRFIHHQLAKMFPEVAERICAIHLGADPSLFKPKWDSLMVKQVKDLKRKLRIDESSRVILFTGRLVPDKGVHVLIPAFKKVLREYPNCCLVIVGSSWFGGHSLTSYIKKVRQQARVISNKILFTNYLPHEALPTYFAMADVSICPSQWEEPFGLVNVESMASGTPVVASASGGITEVITHKETGFLVTDRTNPNAYAKPLLKLLKDKKLALKLGVNGRKAVENYFNWQRAGQELTLIYKDLLSR